MYKDAGACSFGVSRRTGEKRSMDEKEGREPNRTVDERAELHSLLMLAKNGDQVAYGKLLERYDPLLLAAVSAYRMEGMTAQDAEDMKQEASLVFCNAVRSYDSTRDGVAFGLYAKICVGNAMKSFIRSFRRHRHGEIVSIDDDRAIAPHVDRLVDTEDVASGLIARETFYLLYCRIREELSAYENRVWWLYVAGATAGEIGKELGRSEKSVSNAIYRIRRKLRQVLADEFLK